MSTKRKSRIPDPFEPAPWSAFGERNCAEMIRLADAGNTDAGRRLVDWASRCLRNKQPLPESLRVWLAARLEDVSREPARAGEMLRVSHGRGRPTEHAADMYARLEGEAFKDMIAWAVFHALSVEEGPTKPNRQGDPTVFEIVSRWAAQRGGRECSEREAQRWYEERLPVMKAHQAKLAEILKDLES